MENVHFVHLGQITTYKLPNAKTNVEKMHIIMREIVNVLKDTILSITIANSVLLEQFTMNYWGCAFLFAKKMRFSQKMDANVQMDNIKYQENAVNVKVIQFIVINLEYVSAL